MKSSLQSPVVSRQLKTMASLINADVRKRSQIRKRSRRRLALLGFADDQRPSANDAQQILLKTDD
jgi:hypothetical protein